MARTPSHIDIFASRGGQFEDQSDDAAFVIPEDLTTLSTDELSALREQAVTNFDALYSDGSGLTDSELEALSALTEGIEALRVESERRAAEDAERAEAAAALAGRVHQDAGQETDEAEEEDESDTIQDEDEIEVPDEIPAEVEERELVTASARREVRVPMSTLRTRSGAGLPQSGSTPTSIRDVLRAAGEGHGYAAGAGLDWAGVSRIVDKRLQNFKPAQYEAAAARGLHLRQQFSVATIERPIEADLRIVRDDPEHINEVITRARDTSRLPGGALTAAGWCAPNVTLYDLLEVESRDGLYSVPTVTWARGGISRTLGPDFADIFANPVGFHYTEAEVIAGDFDGEGGGSKPCHEIDCPEFEDFRLETDGLCITVDLLAVRGYPELIARVTRGTLVAHDHQLSAARINSVVQGSDAVTMPGGKAALTPLLSAIELQVEHARYIRRLPRTAVFEAVFPFWVRGVIRTDLSRQTGVSLFDVSDAQIDNWFATRGIVPQYIYNWQDLTGAPATITAWPTEVDFVMYPAGTWIEGVNDVITLDTVYDSLLLGQNKYTSLFTEEGSKVVKMGFDSRVVTVPICPDGSTAVAVDLECDGAAGFTTTTTTAAATTTTTTTG